MFLFNYSKVLTVLKYGDTHLQVSVRLFFQITNKTLLLEMFFPLALRCFF